MYKFVYLHGYYASINPTKLLMIILGLLQLSLHFSQPLLKKEMPL
jgi:hypothetical protein